MLTLWRIVFDIHPQKNLAVNEAVLKLIGEEQGAHICLTDLPLDNSKTYKMFTQGQIHGVFEVSSPRTADACKGIKPSGIQDIAALVAFDVTDLEDHIALYAARKHGESPVRYEHPLLEPILQETYGIMAYREQYVQAVESLAGYSRGSADLLRRANLRDDPLLMAKHLFTFVEGCANKNNIPANVANQLFDSLNKASRTCFPKSRALSHALLAYRTAYLKAHYPSEFYSALIEHHLDDPEYVVMIRNEMNTGQ
jgi:DNA polymerase-3 subunit alpha